MTQNETSRRKAITEFVVSVDCLLFVTASTYLLRMFLQILFLLSSYQICYYESATDEVFSFISCQDMSKYKSLLCTSYLKAGLA